VSAVLQRLLDPSTVAMIGGAEAEAAIAECDRLGFSGTIWPVHPTRATVGGRAAVPTVADLPGAPDAALVAVDRHRTIDVVRRLRERGCGGAVCYASGFAEVGVTGAVLQERLVAAAGAMPVLGPNCHGHVNALSGAALWPDVQGCRRVEHGVAIVTQSGNLALTLTMRRGLPLAQVVTVGNQAAVGLHDCVAALAADPRITAIGLHVEQLTDPVAFGRAALAAWERGVPIVALQTGVSVAGATLARTHTASITGAAAAYRALYARYHVAVVDTIPALVGALAVLHAYGWLPGRDVMSLSCSGGEAALVADRAVRHGIAFPALPAGVAADVAHVLHHRVAVTNPLDYHTYLWDDPVGLERLFTAALRAPVDAALLVVDLPVDGYNQRAWRVAVDAGVAAHGATGRPLVVTSVLAELLPPDLLDVLAERGVPAVGDIDTVLAALAAAARPAGRPGQHLAPSPGRHGTVRRRDPLLARRALVAGGIAVPPGVICAHGDVEAVAGDLGYPVTLKVVDVDHRTDVDGVALDLRTADDLRAAAAAMDQAGGRFLVERHVAGAVAELLVGVRREQALGCSVTIGAGGTLVDLLDDTVTLLAPVEGPAVRAALAHLRIGRLLTGHRSRPAGDLAAAVDAICRLVGLVVDDSGIVELEVNPLLVLTDGVCAVDVLLLEATDMATDR
jgi:acyl-CoA synthetase (NDP forming)